MMTPEIQMVAKDLVLGLLQLALLIATGYAVRWVKANISTKQMELAASIGDVVVGAAEQLAAAGYIDYESKYQEALDRAKAQAKRWGFELSEGEWEDFIQDAVKAMKNAGQEIKRAPEK